MDTRETPEQAELRRAARQLTRELGPRTVADLDDAKRRSRLAAAVRNAGWLELRHDGGDGAPLAGGVEAAIIAEALAEAIADVPFTGPVLAADLARRAGAPAIDGVAAAFAPDLIGAAVASGSTTEAPVYAVDAAHEGPVRAYLLVPADDGYWLALVEGEGEGEGEGTDLTRAVVELPAGLPVHPISGTRLSRADVEAWSALGLALTSADLVGVMRGVLDATVA